VTDPGLSTRVRPRSLLLLAGICLVMIFWHLGKLPFYVRGEPREGLVVEEMLKSSEWILPVVNGSYIPFKPPLFHWAAALTAEASRRIDEFTLRFPSALFAALGVFLVYFVGAWIWEEQSGLFAAGVLATTYAWWNGGSLVQVDMTLAFFVTATLVVFLMAYRHRNNEIGIAWPLAIAALSACATLAKGPVGVLVPALVVFFFLLLRHNLAFLKKLRPLPSAALFFLIAGSWYFLALRRGGEAFFLRQIVNENLRTAVGTYGHYQSPFYFIPALFLNMLPWSLFFPAIAMFAYRERGWLSDERVTYLVVWLATVFLFFSIARGKRAIYILPLYPAAALLFGAWWGELSHNPRHRLAAATGYVVAAFCLIVPAVFVLRLSGWDIIGAMHSRRASSSHAELSQVLQSLQSPSTIVWGCLILSGAAGLFLLPELTKRRWNRVFIFLLLAAMGTGIAIKEVYAPALVSERTLKPFMTRVRSAADKEHTAVYLYRAFDYGAVFYAARHVPQFPTHRPFPKPPFFLLMWESEWQRLPQSEDLERVDTSEGLGVNKRDHMALVKVEKHVPVLQGESVLPDDED
jgi:4-amino-4-deoxy-L-arabinose transferase-like glycosyltransferase